LRKSHVLVVDDEELYRRSLERILSRVGHEVSEARDAGEALAIAAAQPVDLVLADIRTSRASSSPASAGPSNRSRR
jgi:DNA-binding NtrC family response regulator